LNHFGLEMIATYSQEVVISSVFYQKNLFGFFPLHSIVYVLRRKFAITNFAAFTDRPVVRRDDQQQKQICSKINVVERGRTEDLHWL